MATKKRATKKPTAKKPAARKKAPKRAAAKKPAVKKAAPRKRKARAGKPTAAPPGSLDCAFAVMTRDWAARADAAVDELLAWQHRGRVAQPRVVTSLARVDGFGPERIGSLFALLVGAPELAADYPIAQTVVVDAEAEPFFPEPNGMLDSLLVWELPPALVQRAAQLADAAIPALSLRWRDIPVYSWLRGSADLNVVPPEPDAVLRELRALSSAALQAKRPLFVLQNSDA